MGFDTDIDALYVTYKSLLPMAQKDEDRLWQKFRLDWNYNSNRIEGNSLTYPETHALFILGTVPKRLKRDIREMKAHDVGIEYLRALASNERPISENDIRELNKIIFKQNYWIETETADGNVIKREIVPGTYKKTSNYVVLRGGGIHKFAEPFEVKARMEKTVKSIRAYIKKQHIPLAQYLAELHHDFINTHPFDDGNGRVCRMLLNYICLKLNWPPVIIKDKHKDDYLVALEQSDSGDLSALETVMQSELEWSLKKSIAAAKGEDIEDTDDIDKEIDFFVQENAPSFGHHTNTDENIKNIYLFCAVPILEILGPRIAKFEEFFTDYHPATTGNALKQAILSGQKYNKTSIGFGYELQQFISDGYSSDILINISIKFKVQRCLIECNIQTRNNFISPSNAPTRKPIKTKRLVKTIEFSETRYGHPADKTVIDKFCSKIGREVLDVVKSYQEKASQT